MVLIFSVVVRSPNYSRGIVAFVNIFMYIYGFSYAWDTKTNSIVALFIPHFHYSNFVVTYYRTHPEFSSMLTSIFDEPIDNSQIKYYSKTALVVLFFVFLIVYWVLQKIIEELDVKIIYYASKFWRKIKSCCKKKRNLEDLENDSNVPEMKPLGDFYQNLKWNHGISDMGTDPLKIKENFKKVQNKFLILKQIWKYFDNFPALSDINIALKKGEITCLLGHNGAGKSTLINILTGFLHPSQGKIYWQNEIMFDGMSHTVNQLREVGIGICTSKDILYESMTVFEHLRLASFIKGISNHFAKIEEIIKLLNLTDYTNVKVSKLSGGCKRKLSIGIALIGDPKIIFLDEPTSSLDPISRKEILDFLLKLKHFKDKIVLLTTHHLEEAELLADFVVVLSRGKTCEAGTLLDLKKKFKVGTQIKITKKNIKNSKLRKRNKRESFSNIMIEIENQLSEPNKQIFKKVTKEQSDTMSIILKTGNMSGNQISDLVYELESKFKSDFYFAINSCTFDDIFREIDRIYEKNDNEDNLSNAFANYSTYIKSII